MQAWGALAKKKQAPCADVQGRCRLAGHAAGLYRVHVFFIGLGGIARHASPQKRIQEDVKGDGLLTGTDLAIGSYFGKRMVLDVLLALS